MQVQLIKDEDGVFELGVVVDAEETAEEMRRAAILVAHKKKVEPDPKRQPVEVVREQLGEEEAAFEIDEGVMTRRAAFALSEVKRDIVGKPQFACSEHVAEGKAFAFHMTCVSVPEIEISSYEPVEVTMPLSEVSDDEVAEQVAALARASADQVTDLSHDVVSKGDTVEIAMETTRDGELVRALTAKRRMYRTGTLSMPDAFDEAILGMKVGEEKTFTFEGPSFETDADGNPLMETFVCTVTLARILTEEKPELDDAWAKRVMPDCSGIDELRGRIKARLTEQRKDEQRKQVEQLAASELAKRVEEKIPDAVYDAAIGETKQIFNDQLAAQGMTFEDYLKKEGIEENQVSMALMMQARTQLFQQLSLNAYARHFGLKLEEGDLDAYFEHIAPGKGLAARMDFERDGRLHAAGSAALRLKAMRHLGEHAITKSLG